VDETFVDVRAEVLLDIAGSEALTMRVPLFF
jgi:hypothetical protein